MFGPYNHGWMFDGGVGMLLGGLWMILIFGIPLLLLAALLKYVFGKRSNGSRRGLPDTLIEPGMQIESEKQTPLDILKAAYARGELSRGEFLQKREDILEK
jgi:putative membrane protein